MDVFDRLLGQDRAATKLRHYAQHPVHAYLFHGPRGTNIRDTMMVFAAALQCERGGCGNCETCQRVLRGTDADVHVADRQGVSWLLEEIHDVERIARRRPLGPRFQIVIMDDIDLTVTGQTSTASALLKTLEEPPTRTIFLLGTSDVSDALATIASRCVDVALAALTTDVVARVLMNDAVASETALLSAASSGGDINRARLLASDPGLGPRLATWRGAPDRLTGTAAGAMVIVDEIHQAIDAAMAPLLAHQDRELQRRLSEAKEAGRRSLPNRAEIERRHKREQRRLRSDELHFGLATLSEVYRRRLIEAINSARDGRSSQRVMTSIDAVEVIGETATRLSTNIDEVLLLADLMLSLTCL